MTVVCKCVAKGQPVRIYQNAPDAMSMVCGAEHEAEDLENMCLEHLVDRTELADLPKVDRGYGACRESDGIWYVFEDCDDA